MSFADKDPTAERAALREILARRSAAVERLHVRHMAALGVTDDPTRSRTRSTRRLHVVQDEVEEALWRAWQEHLSA